MDEISVLIKDLYGTYAPEEYSDDKVKYVKENYKNELDVFVKDFYGKYAPEEYNDGKLKYIEENYNISFKKKTKSVKIAQNKKNAVDTALAETLYKKSRVPRLEQPGKSLFLHE